jgi:hypothetical protein
MYRGLCLVSIKVLDKYKPTIPRFAIIIPPRKNIESY